MTLKLQALIQKAGQQLGADACAAGNHRWLSCGGRGCPHDYTDTCSQTVYQCGDCGTYDYGGEGGPGAEDCATHCQGKEHWDWVREQVEADIALAEARWKAALVEGQTLAEVQLKEQAR